MENPMMENYVFKLENNLLIIIWLDRMLFFLDTADAFFFFAYAEFHSSSAMFSQEQEKMNVPSEAYCKSSWKEH